MIVPMKKYSFLIYHKDYLEFLDKLQEIGVLHVIEKQSGEIEDESLRELYQRINQFSTVIKFLNKKGVESKPGDIADTDGEKILKEVLNIQDDLEKDHQQLSAINKELDQVSPWGDFSQESIDKLQEADLKVRFFTCFTRKFSEDWLSQYNIEEINEIGGQKYFVVIQQNDEELELDAEEIKLPEKSLSQLKKQKGKIENLIEKTGDVLDLYAEKYIPLLEQTRDGLIEQMDFKKVVLNTDKEAEEKLMVLEGWAPKTSEKELVKFLDGSSVYYMAEKPGRDDNPPILLKNNRFAKLFEPIGKLFMLPNYYEIDLTPFFAPFFMLFFGFCLGDAGYGLIFVLGATLYKFKAKKEMKPLLSLVQFLGLSAVIFGSISGTLFGMNLLEDKSTLLSQHIKDLLLNPDEMFRFALVLGGIQIIFGMCLQVVNTIRMKGFVYSLPMIGWVFLIIAGGLLFLLSKVNPDFNVKIPAYIVIGIWGVLVFFFSNPKNIFASIGEGIWSIYTMVTGRLGDLLSYIRLFALGLSSSILGYVFNDLAVQILHGGTPVVSQLFFVVLLLFGHGINIALAALGSFVHPMRLTFVEFYMNNAGFTGGGKEYKPFKNKINY